MEYLKRTYRTSFRQDDLVHFQVVVRQTDLDIGVRRERFSPELVSWVKNVLQELREPLERYTQEYPAFLHSLVPYDPLSGAPPIAIELAQAARLAGVGPMAAVAGAFAQHIGRALARRSKDVIVENGGDIYLRSTRQRRIGIFAGGSPLSNRIALEIKPEETPLGICTSSGTVGPSLSLGRADAAVILSPSASLADAVATAAGNMVQNSGDVQQAAEFALAVKGITGAVIIKNDRMAACGKLKLVPLVTDSQQ
ncbi:MAG: UPF0280 family protein [Desulfotomaculaceae bacterium]|nr:UPF0280 family protein [Desulfotomaculaceae bacterium]